MSSSPYVKGWPFLHWQMPVNGDEEKRVLHLTDPSRQFYRTTLDIDSKNFYFTIGDRQSDVWTMELKRP